MDGLLAYAGAPAEDVALVLVHSGGAKGSGVLAKLRKLATVTEPKSAELRPSEFPQFVATEVKRSRRPDRRRGGRRSSCRRSARTCAPWRPPRTSSPSDFPGETIEVASVKKYFGGRAEAKSFAVADAAFSGRRQAALEELRWALDGGTPPVLVTSAFAGGVRGLARYQGAPPRMKEADLAREVGVPPWKLRSLREQSRGWSEAGLARAIRAVAQADADIKGAASDANYTLERLVLTITGLREPR